MISVSAASRKIGRESWPLFIFLLAAVMACPLFAQTSENVDGPLSPSRKPVRALIDNETIIRMAKAGLGDDLLIQTIQMQPGHYGTAPDDLIALKMAGLSDHVISVIEAHGTGLNVRTHTEPLPDVEPYVPPPQGVEGIGVYYKEKDGSWKQMDPELVQIVSGGFIKSALTHNIIKEDHNGRLKGRESKLILPRPVEFLIYTPDGVQGSEYDVLLFRLNGCCREFRTLTGGVVHSTGGATRDEVQFTPVKIAPHTWTFTLDAKTPGGEYGILPPGTGNITNGGKVYTFAITE
jgi:hypothetical protein